VTDVAIVGGGIVGCATAAACARAGLRVTLCERGALASGASGLELALIPTTSDATGWLELHHFTGGAFLLDRSPPDAWAARRVDVRGAVAALAAEARSHRATIRRACDVKALLVRSGTVRGLLTDDGELAAGAVVVAAGSDGATLCAMAGVPFALETTDGTVAVAERPAGFGEAPLVAGTAWAALDPGGRLVVADRSELQGLDVSNVLDERRIRVSEGVVWEQSLSGTLVVAGGGRWGVANGLAIGAAIAERIAGG
jgi:glycine/D-amino acid oxidase-like deaminating enzyme